MSSSTSDIVDVIAHYQRGIERCCQSGRDPDASRLLHCVERLYKLPITVEHLQATGVGKTVYSLRKYDGEVGVAAKTLVTKWKAMVAAQQLEDEGGDINKNRSEDSEKSDDEDSNKNFKSLNDHHKHISESGQEDNSNNKNEEKQDKKTSQKTNDNRQLQSNDVNDFKNNLPSSSSQKHHRDLSNGGGETIDSDRNPMELGTDSEDEEKLVIVENSQQPKLNEHKSDSSKSDKKNHNSKVSSKHQHSSNSSNNSSSTRSKHSKSEKKHEDNSKKHSTSSRHNENSTGSGDKKISSSQKDSKNKDKYRSSSHDRHKNYQNEKSHGKSDTKENEVLKIESGKSYNDTAKCSNSKIEDKESKSKNDRHRNENKRSERKHQKEEIELKETDKNKQSNEPKSSNKSKDKDKSRIEKRSNEKLEKNERHCSDSVKGAKYKDKSKSKEEDKIRKSDSTNSDHGDHKSKESRSKRVASDDDIINLTKAKIPKTISDVEIDSTTGTSFEEALGMCMPPIKSSKILVKPSKIPSPVKLSFSSSSSSSSSSKSFVANENKTTTSSCSKYSEIKPKILDLLDPNATLKPLDSSIVLDLPTVSISNNYKPMPLNPTVMECVFKQAAPPPPRPRLTDDEALQHGISSKTIRTKIYSGIRTGKLFQPVSLFNLCIRVLQKNIDCLEYTGGVPFDILKPILERATPHQLAIFEEYNPYLMEDSDCLWEQHVNRHYRGQRREEMESYREMFFRCKEEQENKLDILTKKVRHSQKEIAAPVRKTQLAYVDTMVKPPRNIQRKQEQFGTSNKLVATPASRVTSLQTAVPNATKIGDVRLRVAASERDNAQIATVHKPKKAPLMAKTLLLFKGRRR